MIDFMNATTCSGEEPKRETVKELLDDVDNILREMETQIAMISDAIYRGKTPVEKEPTKEPCATPPMIVIMRKQRDTAARLLQEIIEIRETLW